MPVRCASTQQRQRATSAAPMVRARRSSARLQQACAPARPQDQLAQPVRVSQGRLVREQGLGQAPGDVEGHLPVEAGVEVDEQEAGPLLDELGLEDAVVAEAAAESQVGQESRWRWSGRDRTAFR
ncbi:MAG TPA: hypothetical protein VEQ10_16685, partial [Vicinamibacteria bacterium]|nr:hypothetical protein [Vicinamibacteria bacterium]